MLLTASISVSPKGPSLAVTGPASECENTVTYWKILPFGKSRNLFSLEGVVHHSDVVM